ncbi:MAG: YihY/virulence factor BrkB family protein [Lachnospiraceae bacterium]
MIKKLYDKCIQASRHIAHDNVSAYAAMSAFFLVLSMIPIILLLLTLVQYTPVTKADVMTAVVQVFPKSINPMIVSIVNQVYNQTRVIIPLTAITAFWSAGRGVLAMGAGLNCIHGNVETRNYIFLRIRAGVYTLLFVVSIVLSLVLLVFGNRLSIFVNMHLPFLSSVMNHIIQIRMIGALIILTVFSSLIYRFLPNRKVKFRTQLPGAIMTALGWALTSFVFSVYVDIFRGFSDMYGSLTTIVLIMLWFYVCMYIMLLGGELNDYLMKHPIVRKRDEKMRNVEDK